MRKIRRSRQPVHDPDGPAVRTYLARHSLAARLVMAVVLPVLVLGSLELGLRAGGYGYPTRLFLPVADSDLYGANVKFGYRFFPHNIARKPLWQAFDRDKAPGTCRIFVLGASAAVGFPNPAGGFGQILDVILSERYPGVNFEVINAAITAINSHVVLPIARECADYEPDLFLVYLGNNEVIGPFGLSSSRNPVVANRGMIRFVIALRTTRIGQLLKDLGAKVHREGEGVRESGFMNQYARHRVAADDPQLVKVHENYRRNLEDICRAGTEAGARVVLSTVAVNLRDSAPFASLADTTLAPAAYAAWQRTFQAGSKLAAAGDHAAARDSFLAAATLEPQHAETRYRLGQSLLAVGDTAGAQPQYLAAVEYDALRFRIDQRLNDIIRSTAATDGILLADSEVVFRREEPSGTGLPGHELFYEHVHLNFAGNYLMAKTMLLAVEAGLPDWVRERQRPSVGVPKIEYCAHALVFTAWNEYQNLSEIRKLAVNYPFTAQADHSTYLANLDRRLAELQPKASGQQAQDLVAIYYEALNRRPDDLLLGVNLVKLLNQIGNKAEARRVGSGILATQPR